MLVGTLVVGLWLLAGAPWWPPAAALAAILVVGLLRRLLPRRLCRPAVAGGVVGAMALIPELSVGAWLLATAGLIAVAVLTHGDRMSGQTRGRVWLRASVTLAVVLAASGVVVLVVDHVRVQQQRAQQWEQASEFNRAQLLPGSPTKAGRVLLQAVARSDASVCETVFTPGAAAQLAAATGALSCPAAVRVLADRVVDPHRYPVPDSHATPQALAPDAESGSVDLCHLTWDGVAAILNGTAAAGPAPGPQLGRLDLTRVLGQGYQVDRVAPC